MLLNSMEQYIKNNKFKYKPFQYLGSYRSTAYKCLVFLDVHCQEGLQILQICHSNLSSGINIKTIMKTIWGFICVNSLS